MFLESARVSDGEIAALQLRNEPKHNTFLKNSKHPKPPKPKKTKKKKKTTSKHKERPRPQTALGGSEDREAMSKKWSAQIFGSTALLVAGLRRKSWKKRVGFKITFLRFITVYWLLGCCFKFFRTLKAAQCSFCLWLGFKMDLAGIATACCPEIWKIKVATSWHKTCWIKFCLALLRFATWISSSVSAERFAKARHWEDLKALMEPSRSSTWKNPLVWNTSRACHLRT